MTRTVSATHAVHIRSSLARTVVDLATLRTSGTTDEQVHAHVAAGRWRRCGRAVVLHTAELTVAEKRQAALVNAGTGSVLTSFTALEVLGLRNWSRGPLHVLMRDRRPRFVGTGLDVRAHFAKSWPVTTDWTDPQLHERGRALARAAGELPSVRSAIGIVAASVTQKIVVVPRVLDALHRATRTRHRRALIAACHDIEQGAQALSEIDLVELCRRHRLPLPVLQRVRVQPDGRRRYLDASWELPDGTVVGVEVDGAYHLDSEQQTDDSLRQNALVLGGARLLRFPAWMVRECPADIVRALRQLLAPLIAAAVAATPTPAAAPSPAPTV